MGGERKTKRVMGYSALKKNNGLTSVKKVYYTTENRDLKWTPSLHDCLIAGNVSLVKNIFIFIKKKKNNKLPSLKK